MHVQETQIYMYKKYDNGRKRWYARFDDANKMSNNHILSCI